MGVGLKKGTEEGIFERGGSTDVLWSVAVRAQCGGLCQ
jgi:hypothetical protein